MSAYIIGLAIGSIIGYILGCVTGFINGRSRGAAEGFAKGVDSGWIDRGLADWRKNIERRDRLGRFKERATK